MTTGKKSLTSQNDSDIINQKQRREIMKKAFTSLLLVITALTLVACKAANYTVTFDSRGGSAVEAQKVVEGKFATKPTDPTRADYSFRFWTADATANTEFKFAETAIKANTTLYAVWVELDKSVLSFDSRGGSAVASQIVLTGGTASAVAAPTREDYRFGGWFETKMGGTWRDANPVDVASTVVSEDKTLYAYWEPVNSKSVSYPASQTYVVAIGSDSAHINPLTYTDNGQQAFFGLLSAGMYDQDVDWSKAIKDGMAAYEGDFSKIKGKDGEGQFLAAAFDYAYKPVLADGWPADADGNDYEKEDGSIDKELAGVVKSPTWTYKIKDNMKFENGDKITADTFEYTLKMYVDPVLLNTRAAHVYDSQYLNLKNSKEYMEGTAEWSAVGFEKLGELEFKLTFYSEITQKQAIDMIDIVTLLNPTAFDAGFTTPDKRTNNYGTVDNKFVSYGPYVVKEWSQNARWVFNKNYDFVNKAEISYKSLEYQVIANEDQREQLFADGVLNAFGLSATYYAKYANDESILSSPDAYTLKLSFNNNARTDGKQVPSIVADHDFRMAFFYGINRNDFAAEAAAPDVPKLAILSDIHLTAITNLIPYNDTQYHLDVVNDAVLDLSPETNGYLPNKAITLFNQAYAKWAVGDNAGKKVVLELPVRSGSVYYEKSAEFIEKELEDLFGPDKLDIQVKKLAADVYGTATKGYNYDIAFNGMGGATSFGLFFMYAIYGQLYGPGYTFEPGWGIPEMELEIDFSDYYELISAKPVAELEDYELLFLNGVINEGTEDEVKVVAVGEGGIWKGTMTEFASFSELTIEEATEYDLKHENNYIAMAAIERAIFELMPLIPLTATANSTVYNDIVVEWPAYTILFGWGGQKYRYISTDVDYQ